MYNTLVKQMLWHGMLDGQTSTRAKKNVTDMRILHWMCRYIGNDLIKNEDFRGKLGVVTIEDKMREIRLR